MSLLATLFSTTSSILATSSLSTGSTDKHLLLQLTALPRPSHCRAQNAPHFSIRLFPSEQPASHGLTSHTHRTNSHASQRIQSAIIGSIQSSRLCIVIRIDIPVLATVNTIQLIRRELTKEIESGRCIPGLLDAFRHYSVRLLCPDHQLPFQLFHRRVSISPTQHLSGFTTTTGLHTDP